MHQEKVMLSLEEQLRADSSGSLALAISQRLEEISVRLEAAHRKPKAPNEHQAIESARHAVQGAQLVMQLFDISRKGTG